MKGIASRTSRISSDGREGFDNSIPGIPDSKWQEFLEKEENDIFLLGLRDEILQNTFEKIFEKYLEKQAVAFTVHCSYLAWVKVLDVFYMFKDRGDYEDPKVVESWKPDDEPTPSKVDSWATECMEVKAPEVVQPAEKHRKGSSVKRSSTDLTTESLESMSFMADLFEGAEEEYWPVFSVFSSSDSTRKKSIFTRTLSMPRDFLPEVVPLTFFPSCQEIGSKSRKGKSRENIL